MSWFGSGERRARFENGSTASRELELQLNFARVDGLTRSHFATAYRSRAIIGLAFRSISSRHFKSSERVENDLDNQPSVLFVVVGPTYQGD